MGSKFAESGIRFAAIFFISIAGINISLEYKWNSIGLPISAFSQKWEAYCSYKAQNRLLVGNVENYQTWMWMGFLLSVLEEAPHGYEKATFISLKPPKLFLCNLKSEFPWNLKIKKYRQLNIKWKPIDWYHFWPIVEAWQLHSNSQFYWSSVSTVCFSHRGMAVCAPGMHPHLQWNQGSPVSDVLLHWWPWHDPWSLATTGSLCSQYHNNLATGCLSHAFPVPFRSLQVLLLLLAT